MAAQSPSDVELPNLTKKSSTTKEPSACSIHSNNRRDSSVEAPASDEWVQVDLFTPFPAHPDLPVENYPLTLRAVLVGWVLGAVVNASNVYVGLKAGIANDANMFATLLGYVCLQMFQRMGIPLLAGIAGPREHNIIQTVATSTGGLSTLFIGSVPAMYQLGLLNDEPTHDYWRLVTLTACSAFFGTAISIGMRRLVILDMARELQLTFPSAVAIATAIRNLHLRAKDGEVKKAVQILLISFVVALCWVISTSYAKGILFDWYPFWWFYVWGNYNNSAIFVLNWGFQTIEWTPLFLGYGMILGFNIAYSWYLGYVLAFGVIGPILVAHGHAQGIAYDPRYPDLVTFMALEIPDPLNYPSPRYWLLWSAILMMVTASLTNLVVNWKLLFVSVQYGYISAVRFFQTSITRIRQRESSFLARQVSRPMSHSRITDHSPKRDQVPALEFWVAVLLSTVLVCIIMGIQYKINIGLTILMLVLTWVIAIMAVQCTGQSGASPISAVSNVTQLVIGGICRSYSGPLSKFLLTNLALASVSGTAAQQACEMTTDFKIGFFLGTSPRQQWYAQWIGTIPAIFLSPAMFVVFMKGFPCVLNLEEAATCTFSAPAAQSFRAIATAVLSPVLLIPRSSWIFTICACVFTVGIQLLRHWAHKAEKRWLQPIIPNMLIVGFGVLVPASQYGLALLIGAGAAAYWRKKNRRTFEAFSLSVAAGMIAGESISGLVAAVLNIANVSGPTYYGTVLGCPAGNC